MVGILQWLKHGLLMSERTLSVKERIALINQQQNTMIMGMIPMESKKEEK